MFYHTPVLIRIRNMIGPITESEGERIIARSANYLSAFTEFGKFYLLFGTCRILENSIKWRKIAEWHTIAPGSPTAATALTAEELNSGTTPAAVFLRQRYPNLRFEIYVDHSSYELRELVSGKAPINLVNSTWKAYLRAGIGAPNFSMSLISILRLSRKRQ